MTYSAPIGTKAAGASFKDMWTWQDVNELCGSCNRIKGNRPMEYLRLKIETIQKTMKQTVVFGE